ncbi:MAG: fumarylacetoacetate hydrolase family protein, partial [Planctomycetota bacterium]
MKLVRVDHDGWSSIAVDAGAGELLELREIIGIGRNYAEHAKERGAEVPDRPLVFTKNIASIVLDGEDVVVPASCRDPETGGEQVDFEGELAVVIGRPARDVPPEAALECVLGYCIANDVSARWWQKQGGGGQFW